MREGSFIWGHLEKQHRKAEKWIDWLWLLVLLIAAVLLFSVNLGELPLQDGEEATVAQVAKEIWRATSDDLRWLYPTLGGEAYHHKPPLLHIMIAAAYSLGGVNEWTARLPGAIITSFSVPLLYCLSREIFRHRWVAIYSALVYLTMLPVVRYGRLAIFDGVVVSCLLVMMLCLLRSRRDLRYCLGIGLSFGCICLTQGLAGIFLGAVAIAFLYWDTPRLLHSRYFWLAMLLGTLPAVAWYTAQILYYGHSFIANGLVNQLLNRSVFSPEHSRLPWFYLLEMFKWTWPWLVFLPHTSQLVWENRNLSWSRLILVWCGLYLLLISFIGAKYAWYILPIYPALALALGAQLAEIENIPLLSPYPRGWIAGFSILAVVASFGSIYFSWGTHPKTDLQLIFAAVAMTMTLVAILAERGDGQFLRILFWGTYISLLLLMKSHYWAWELWETYPVKPVAEMIHRVNPKVTKIYTSFPQHRPSLNFYSDRTILPIPINELQNYWQSHQQPYILINADAMKNLNLDAMKSLDEAEGWKLVTKQGDR